jgi:hypothetical protein
MMGDIPRGREQSIDDMMGSKFLAEIFTRAPQKFWPPWGVNSVFSGGVWSKCSTPSAEKSVGDSEIFWRHKNEEKPSIWRGGVPGTPDDPKCLAENSAQGVGGVQASQKGDKSSFTRAGFRIILVGPDFWAEKSAGTPKSSQVARGGSTTCPTKEGVETIAEEPKSPPMRSIGDPRIF